jgi:hypothetical protein
MMPLTFKNIERPPQDIARGLAAAEAVFDAPVSRPPRVTLTCSAPATARRHGTRQRAYGTQQKTPPCVPRAVPGAMRPWRLHWSSSRDRRPDRNSDCPAAGAAAGPIMRTPARVAGRLSPRVQARYAPG